MSASKNHVRRALEDFLEDAKPGVLALKGRWGVGKTYTWREFIAEYKGKARHAGYAYVSLFGITSIAELRQAFFAKHEPLSAPKLRGWRRFRKASANILKHVDFNSATWGLLKNTEVFSEWVQDKIVRDFIVCIDDLDRKEEALTGSALLGLITSLRDERNCKVILLYNDAEISEELDASFGEYREKVIDRELVYAPSVEEAFSIIFPEEKDPFLDSNDPGHDYDVVFGGDRRTVRELFQCLNVTNIRVLQKTRGALEYFERHVKDSYPKLYPQFVRQTVKLCCLYFMHGKELSLDTLITTSPWRDIRNRSEDDNPERQRERDQRKPVRDIGYAPRDTDSIIADYLRSGYVRWDTYAPLLRQVEKRHESMALNTKHTKVWDLCWANFRASPEQAAAAQCEFLKSHWREIPLRDVESAVRFLRELDPTVDLEGILKCKIEQFVKERESPPSLADVHGLSPETLARIEKEIAASVTPIPIEGAVMRLTRPDGWNCDDFRYFSNVSAEEFYQFCTESEMPDLLARLKELRSRLLSSETGAPIAGRLDEALLRMARRSKLDTFRVRQTGMEVPATEPEHGNQE